MRNIVLDSYAVISYLNKEEGYSKVAEVFTECVADNKKAFLCVVNLGEVYYHALRVGGETKANLALEAVRILPIEIVEANFHLTISAAEYKAFHKMSYADAYAAALAKTKKAVLVTGDKEFKALEKEIKINWI